MSERSNRISVEQLSRHAKNIRRHVVKMVGRNGQGYVQQGLGAAEVFTQLWFSEARMDAGDPQWSGRDRIFLSTAHNSAVFHATLAERGVIERDRLESYTRDGSKLEINVSERLGPMVESTCGSLGQALSVATGVCMTARRQNSGQRCYVILGDGELQEGQVWEAAMFAGARGLGNLCLIIDMNNLQVEGSTEKVMVMEPVADKFAAFGWAVEDVDGHDFQALANAFDMARERLSQPTVILARTLVGKGISFLEGQMSHNLVFPLSVAERALAELED